MQLEGGRVVQLEGGWELSGGCVRPSTHMMFGGGNGWRHNGCPNSSVLVCGAESRRPPTRCRWRGTSATTASRPRTLSSRGQQASWHRWRTTRYDFNSGTQHRLCYLLCLWGPRPIILNKSRFLLSFLLCVFPRPYSLNTHKTHNTGTQP